MSELKQIAKIKTDEIDGTEDGRVEWCVHYTVYETKDDDGFECFDIYCGDDLGNGRMICRGRRRFEMISLACRLGELIEYAEGVAPSNA